MCGTVAGGFMWFIVRLIARRFMSWSDANAKHRWYTIDRRGRDRPTLAPLTPAPHSAGLFLGPLGTPLGGLAVPSLRAFHHSTNIGSRIDLIDDLEVGENLPRRKLFDFLLRQ